MTVVNVLLERASENWCASSGDDCINGLVAVYAKTREGAIEEFRVALKAHIEALKSQKIEYPEVAELNIQELVPA